MMSSFWHSFTLVAITALVTLLTRAAPFLLFGTRRETPKLVLYLGRVLPPAIMAVLVVYCLRGVSFLTPSAWLPQLLAAGITVLLHLWRRSTILSISGGTICYMVLLRVLS